MSERPQNEKSDAGLETGKDGQPSTKEKGSDLPDNVEDSVRVRDS